METPWTPSPHGTSSLCLSARTLHEEAASDVIVVATIMPLSFRGDAVSWPPSWRVRNGVRGIGVLRYWSPRPMSWRASALSLSNARNKVGIARSFSLSLLPKINKEAKRTDVVTFEGGKKRRLRRRRQVLRNPETFPWRNCVTDYVIIWQNNQQESLNKKIWPLKLYIICRNIINHYSFIIWFYSPFFGFLKLKFLELFQHNYCLSNKIPHRKPGTI